METIYDWVTVAMFAGLIILFLERSGGHEPPRDHIWQYLVASVGLMLVNYLGNNDQHLLAVATLAVVIGFVVYYLRPLDRGGA